MPHEPQGIEHVQEEIQHHAAHDAHEKWVAGAALTAAILAALAAITGALAGVHLTESSRAQIESNDFWGFYQAKSIKSAILTTKVELLGALGKEIEGYRTATGNYPMDLAALGWRRERMAALGLLGSLVVAGALRESGSPLPPAHVARLALPTPVSIEGRLASEPVRWATDRTRLRAGRVRDEPDGRRRARRWRHRAFRW